MRRIRISFKGETYRLFKSGRPTSGGKARPTPLEGRAVQVLSVIGMRMNVIISLLKIPLFFNQHPRLYKRDLTGL